MTTSKIGDRVPGGAPLMQEAVQFNITGIAEPRGCPTPFEHLALELAADLAAIREQCRKARRTRLDFTSSVALSLGIDTVMDCIDRIFDLTLPPEYRSREESR